MKYESHHYYNLSVISAIIALALAFFYNKKKNLSKDLAMIYQIAIALAAVIAISSYYRYTKMSESFEETKVSRTFRVGDILQRFRVRERLHAADINLKQIAKMIHESNYDVDQVLDGVKDYEITVSAPAAEIVAPVEVIDTIPSDVIPDEIERKIESICDEKCGGYNRSENYIPSLRKDRFVPTVRKLRGPKY